MASNAEVGGGCVEGQEGLCGCREGPSKETVGIWRLVWLGGMIRECSPRVPRRIRGPAGQMEIEKGLLRGY